MIDVLLNGCGIAGRSCSRCKCFGCFRSKGKEIISELCLRFGNLHGMPPCFWHCCAAQSASPELVSCCNQISPSNHWYDCCFRNQHHQIKLIHLASSQYGGKSNFYITRKQKMKTKAFSSYVALYLSLKGSQVRSCRFAQWESYSHPLWLV